MQRPIYLLQTAASRCDGSQKIDSLTQLKRKHQWIPREALVAAAIKQELHTQNVSCVWWDMNENISPEVYSGGLPSVVDGYRLHWCTNALTGQS